MNEKNIKMIEQEINALLNLNHPHCLEVKEILEDENYFYIASPLLEGGDLIDRIEKIQ